MCGLAGFIEFSGSQASCDDLIAMQETIAHRGPDDKGYYFEPGLGLCHRRLSIIDLSEKAHQPMQRDGLTILYNGEIYNYRELKNELTVLGHSFVSHSDTEVVLEAYREWGKEALLRFNGMFAFAIYDHKEGNLFLARDKAGVKPLVYYFDNSCFVFASEIKAITAYPYFQKKLSKVGLEHYLRFGYLTGKQTIWENCFCLLSGQCLTVNVKSRSVNTQVYWEPSFKSDFSGGFSKATKELKDILVDEFQQSMVSDVPVGVCISGGVDSNVLISILSKELGFSIRTYSLGSDETEFNENLQAEAVAKYLGTRHRSLTLGSHSNHDLLMETIFHYDQPISDQNILSFRHIARESKKDGVSVLLSGMGGDELFFGYPSVTLRSGIGPLFKIPRKVRNVIPKELFRSWNKLYKGIQLFQLENHLSAVANISGKCFFDDEIDQLLLDNSRDGSEDYFKSVFLNSAARNESMVEGVMQWDLRSYLVDNGFYISDTSSMAEGVEMRVPYLNNKVLDFALNVPVKIKRHKGVYKALLRAIESQYLPKHLLMKRKRGFYPFPKRNWLDGGFKDHVNEYLSEKRFKKQSIFNYDVIRNIMDIHNNSNVNVSDKLWNMLIFQMWAQRNL